MLSKKHYINNNWQLKLQNSYDNEVHFEKKQIIPATVPGTVHTDLLNAGVIDEPYHGDNELRLKWIDLCDWSYSTQFDLSEGFDFEGEIHLVFEGLDTVADIILNGKKIDHVKNMFLKYDYEVSSILKEKENSLEVIFYSAKRYSLAEEKKYGKIPVPDSTQSDRVYLRKAQYSYGWDWGPAFTTMGIWRDVYLQQKKPAEITGVKFDTTEITEENAACSLSFSVVSGGNHTYEASIELCDDNNARIYSKQIHPKGDNQLDMPLHNVKLWWPNGLGSQNLYTLKIKLSDESGVVIDEWTQKVGLRIIKLSLEENNNPMYRFIVNNKPVYIKGVNWIPGDSFLTRVTREKYSNLLNTAKDASMNMVRVWGGGIYENDEFYELCDELGLLVWQDCMFACGSYPEHKEFLQSVEMEVEYNLKRIRNHASLSILCGNNENEWIWTMDHDSHYDNMPGYKIYHELIPEIAERIAPKLAYWPSSPFGYDKDPNSQTSGNRHQWYIWSGWKDYSEVVDDNSLFVTEFGFQGPANIDTFKKYISEENLRIHDRVFEFHNKQIEGQERVLRFLAGHLPLPKSWAEFIYLAQLNQGFALKTCLEHWRGNQPTTNGSIIWQINDTWPVTSWALVDWEQHPKLSYYFVKNSFKPVLLTIDGRGGFLKLSIVNETDAIEGNAVVKIFESSTGELFEEFNYDVNIEASLRSEIALIDYPQVANSVDWIAVATLYDKDGEIVSRNYFASQKWKHMQICDVHINMSVTADSVKLSSDKPVYFADLYHPGIVFNNRGLILQPGEEIEIDYKKLDATELDTNKLEINNLNKFLSAPEKP